MLKFLGRGSSQCVMENGQQVLNVSAPEVRVRAKHKGGTSEKPFSRTRRHLPQYSEWGREGV